MNVFTFINVKQPFFAWILLFLLLTDVVNAQVLFRHDHNDRSNPNDRDETKPLTTQSPELFPSPMPPEQPLTDVTYAECERMYSTDITLLREPYRTRYVAQKTRCLEEARRYENYRQQQSQIKEDPHGGRTLALILLGIIALPITIWALTR